MSLIDAVNKALKDYRVLSEHTGVKQFDKLDFEWAQSEVHFRSRNGTEYQLLVECDNKDHSLLVYPLHLLATNRTCETMISRQKKSAPRFISDLSNIRNVSGLFAGMLPYSLNYARTMWTYELYKKEDGLFL